MESLVNRIASQAFWRTGLIAGIALAVLLGVQVSNWVKAGDTALAAANAETRLSYPGAAWAFAMQDRCRSRQGEFSQSRITMMRDCNSSVLREAREQGQEQSVAQALDAQGAAGELALKAVNPSWPLSVFHQPLWRFVVWLTL